MPAHSPVGRCCTRPWFNFAGGVDDCVWTHLVRDMNLIGRATMGLGATTTKRVLAAWLAVSEFVRQRSRS